jgi:hypothetical protein
MKQIPVFFEMVQRSAIIIRPKQPFWDWLDGIHPGFKHHDEDDDDSPDIYLLPDFEEMKAAETWLKKNFDLLFCTMLNDWYTDESHWVPKRTFKMFKEWFDYTLHTTVYDTLEEPIEKE